ncbi:unnamed protein product [Rodentolepis nana]|uniref:Endo/exonuclease/phosphatase domain-containing protein n=1 Tax=Rodentolepis nana TaxID=102285 RepID=A0A0R3TZP9_RODNA|nr:unnamed protein product [Rodentolepis nana]
MPTGRFGCGAVNVPDLGVLVLGGQGVSGRSLNIVELFQISAGNLTWCSFTSMLMPRSCPAVEFFQGYVYVAGSRYGSPQTAEFLSITNGRQGQWTLISQSPTIGGYLISMLAVNNHLYVVAQGGNVYELETPHEENNRKIAGKEIEDMLNSNPLELIYSNGDPATYLHYNGTRTTPDLLLASSDISEHTRRKIIGDPGSGHKPVIASITFGSKSMTWKVPTKLSGNFKKADWPIFTNLLDNELHTSPLKFKQHPGKLCNDITNIMIRCAKKTIPRGKTKHYRVFWSEHLEELNRKRDALRNTTDQTGERKT